MRVRLHRSRAAGVQAPHWAQVIGRTASRDKIAGINSRLAHLLVTRFGARQGALLVGRALPLGIGAGIGAAGNGGRPHRDRERTSRIRPGAGEVRAAVVDAKPYGVVRSVYCRRRHHGDDGTDAARLVPS